MATTSQSQTTTVLELKTDSDWIALHESLVSDLTTNKALANILEQLCGSGVQSAIVENDYGMSQFKVETIVSRQGCNGNLPRSPR